MKYLLIYFRDRRWQVWRTGSFEINEAFHLLNSDTAMWPSYTIYIVETDTDLSLLPSPNT